MFSLLLTFLSLLSSILGDTNLHTGPGIVSLRAEVGEVFVFLITPQYFNVTSSPAILRYRASQLYQPSLPDWLTFHQLEGQQGLLYGVPPSQGHTKLQVLATDTNTFNTHRLLISLHSQQLKSGNDFQVSLKIDNLNVEDVFDERRKDRLLNLFKTRFWTEAAEDIHLSFAESALNVGGRRPLKPSSKDGVVVRLGSKHNFSSSLLSLDKETEPLRKHQSCSYKRVSIERYFRQSGLAVDWCSFRLLSVPTQDPLQVDKKDFSKRPLDWTFPLRAGLERRSKAVEIVSATLLPMVIFSSFLVLVCLLLFTDCGLEKEENSVFLDSLFDVFEDCGLRSRESQEQQQLIRDNNNSVEMAVKTSTSPCTSQRDLRSSSVHRQTETLRALARRRDVTPRLQQTPTLSVDGSSLHSRSRTASPCPSNCGSPGPRDSYNWEMFESLNRPQPPAYNSLPRGTASPGS